MAEFYNIQVKDIYKETKECSVVSFNIPENLHKIFDFKQGQHLTLRKIINDEDVRRSYSLCSSPLDKEWRIAIKQIPGGVFSTYANTELKTGDTLEIAEPTGHFYIETEASHALNT